jgi:SynChlorMet cassette radical SAM/SPASM protein ScmE
MFNKKWRNKETMIRYTKVPHSVRILLTDQCNLYCNFCLINASEKANTKELHTAEWLRFFESLKKLRVFNISISGGEIFLRHDLFVLLKKLRENRMHRITLLTNGTLITKEIANQLSRINMKNISISVDGLKEKHEQIRGKGTFLRTVKGLQCLLGVGIIPRISFTPVKSNYKDLAPLIDLMVSLGITVIHVNTLTPEGRCLEIYSDIALEYPLQVKEVLDVIEEKKKEYPGTKINSGLGFYYYLPQSYMYFEENPQNYEMKHLKDGCGAASTSCVITPTGDVIPCEGFKMFTGGNIREQDLLDIWNNSRNFKTIRDLSKITMDQIPYCKDCKYIYLCDGGCRALAYLVHKDLLAPSILCPSCKQNQRKKKCLSGDYKNEGKKSNSFTNVYPVTPQQAV